MKDTTGAAQQLPDAPQSSGATTIQLTTRAWITSYTSMQSFLAATEAGDPKALAELMHFSNHDMSAPFGWTEVGTASVTVELATRDELVQTQLNVLKAKLTKERAESQQRQNAILDSISKLSALTYEAEA